MCVVCGAEATKCDFTLCLDCWNDAEGEIIDIEDAESEIFHNDY